MDHNIRIEECGVENKEAGRPKERRKGNGE